jgi:DivIVA domain-containing protein
VGRVDDISSAGRRSGYDKQEVDAFRSAVRDTFLGGAVFWVSTPPVKSDDVRGKQFSTRRRGYDKEQVEAFLEAAGLRLAAMESPDRPEDHWLAAPSLSRGPSGPTRRHSRPPGPMTLRRSTPSGKRFATHSSGQANPR